MNLEKIYQELKAEREGIQYIKGDTLSNRLQTTHAQLIEYDLRSFQDGMQAISKSNLLELNKKQVSDLGDLIESGLKRASDFMEIKPKFKVLKLDKAEEFCTYIAEGFSDYKEYVKGAFIGIESFFDTELSRIKSGFEKEDKYCVAKARENLDKLAGLYACLREICNSKKLNIPYQTKQIEQYAYYAPARASVSKACIDIKTALGDVKWGDENFSYLKQTYEENFSKQGILNRKMALVKKAEEAGYYEGALEAIDIEKELKNVLDNWQQLANSHNELVGNTKTLSKIIALLEKKDITVPQFCKLADTGFAVPSRYDCLRSYSNEKIRNYELTIKAFNLAKNNRAKILADELFSGKQEEISTALKSENLGELKKANHALETLLSDMKTLSKYADISAYQKSIAGYSLGINKRIDFIQTELERQHELSKKKIEADEKLRREEIGRKYDFEKQSEDFRKKEEAYERRLQEIEKGSESLARSLKEEKEDKKAHEKTIDALMENIGKTLQVGKESMDEFGKELSANLYKKFCDQLGRELKRVEESISAYGSNTNVLAGRINAFQSDLTAIRNELSEIRKERGQGINRDQQKNISNPINDSLGGINKKLEEISETVSKQTTGQPSTVTYIGTYINNLTVVEQKEEKKMFDFIYTIKKMLPPKSIDLNQIRDNILKNNKSLPDKLLSLREYFGSDWDTLQNTDDLNWLKYFRDNLVDEINFGTTGYRIRKGGLIRAQFNDIVNCVINPYIARCEQALSAACIN